MAANLIYVITAIVFCPLVYCIITMGINMIFMSYTSKCNYRCDQGRKCTCFNK